MGYYIAYGSNLNIEQMGFRCPDSRIIGVSELEDFQLLFKGSKTGSYLTIERKAGSRVPVAVWEVSESDEKKLDRYEGYPNFYYKRHCLINHDGGLRDAFVYIMHEDRKLGVPSDYYVETCLEGYKDFCFDRKYIDKALEISRREAKYGAFDSMEW